MSRDPIEDYIADRERRLANAASQINDTANNVGRFGLIERRRLEDAARIEGNRREQAVAFLRRKLMRDPTEAEIDGALQR